MSYTVLARRYRSKNFDELIGQEAIATTLKNAIKSDRVAHAYLFTGTRGVGKTSCARILAKALNCEKGPTPEPCCECPICIDIARGEDVDVIEIDGASNTSVDDIRQLRSNAIYHPARARFKIYIIDEVHMISTSAFNALLKTLEEPPEHVKFIFATTEPNKVPITIQSRCQRFDFRPIPKSEIAEHIKKILKEEKIKAEDSVVERIARLANGSMRDALSLLDQLLSTGEKKLTAKIADRFLPVPPVEQYSALIDALIASDAACAIKVADDILSSGVSPGDFCFALSEYMRDLMIASVCNDDKELLLLPESIHAKLIEQAKALPAIKWTYGLTIVQELGRAIKFSEQSRILIDAAIVTLSSLKSLIDINESESNSTKALSDMAPQASSTLKSKKKVDEEPIRVDKPSGSFGSQNREKQEKQQAISYSAVTAEPVVRKTIEIFEGRLVDVNRASKRNP